MSCVYNVSCTQSHLRRMFTVYNFNTFIICTVCMTIRDVHRSPVLPLRWDVQRSGLRVPEQQGSLRTREKGGHNTGCLCGRDPREDNDNQMVENPDKGEGTH
jgi:hypothetical protein